MKIELGWCYIYIGREGVHIEFERHPWYWLCFDFSNKRAFDTIEESLRTQDERWESLPT